MRNLVWALVGTVACQASVDVSPDDLPARPAVCEEHSVEDIALDDAIDTSGATPRDWLAAVEGTWQGRAGGRSIETTIGLGDGPVELVTSIAAEGARGDVCPARVRLPVVQTLWMGGHLVAEAEGTWDTMDGSVSFATGCPLLYVDGASPRELVPSEWETLDLRLQVGGGDDVVDLTAEWWATRETEAATSQVAAGPSSTDEVTVAGAREALFHAVLSRR